LLEHRQRAERVRAALARREDYLQGPDAVEVRETHISWVFLAGERAYKLKKPLVLEFLDYGTPERRRRLCDEEVRLNRLLAPEIYLGVLGVAEWVDGVELVAEDDPHAVDYLVEMRRYDERHTLAARLQRDELEPAQVAAVGRRLARFHSQARQVAAASAPVLAVERRFERNLHELFGLAETLDEIDRLLALERFAHAFITAYAQTFHSRATGGYVRDGHGDLRTEHVLVNGDVQVVDCVEFDPGLRELDVADDLAFLVFDLVARGGERFVETLVHAYRDGGGDPGGDSLISFYASYRALVRAKVALVRASQLSPASAAHREARAHAAELIALAERFAWRARLPLVVVVCGLPASGKSTLAHALAQAAGLPYVSSDLTRKRLAGVQAGERAPADTYTVEWNARTYAELGRRAAGEVAARRGAIVDATFRHRADRRVFAAAFGSTAAGLLFVECQAPGRVLAERAAARDRDRLRASDADVHIVRRERHSCEPLEEVPASAHVALRTDRPLQETLGDVLALLDRRLLGRSLLAQ
jgi:aminoglycoside phosphotransferase family enzyme/predicted kinase